MSLAKYFKFSGVILICVLYGALIFTLKDYQQDLSSTKKELAFYKEKAETLEYYITLSDHYTKAANLVWGDRSKRCDAGLVMRTSAIVSNFDSIHITLEQILAVMTIESGFNEGIKSYANAYGLMQVQLPTARKHKKDVTIQELKNEVINTRIGIQELQELYETFGNEELALLSYNRGPNKVKSILSFNLSPDNGYPGKVLKYQFASYR